LVPHMDLVSLRHVGRELYTIFEDKVVLENHRQPNPKPK
jgi:hypothetical protein